MKTYFVRVDCDVKANLIGDPLRYRLYVADELFTERTWIWDNAYLEESLSIQAVPGQYPIRLETVDPQSGQITIDNFRVQGPGQILHMSGQTVLEISNALA